MTPIKGILFDKDGTLLDFNGTWLGTLPARGGVFAGAFWRAR